jgi:hypothetical protein
MRSSRSTAGVRFAAPAATLLCTALLLAPTAAVETLADEPTTHLLISEVMTGGASASDEFIEIYNPGLAALPLEGLELVYVTATGATISRRADWAAGALSLGPGEHVLVANAAGTFAPIADVVFASGMAATGGSVALRIQGASSAIDAVGWGTAASVWMEGTAAPAPAAGETLERRPGGAAGSGQDSDDNAVDLRTSPIPDPQNSTSPPVPDPSATPIPTPPVTAEPSPSPSSTPTPPGETATPTASATTQPTSTPGASVVSIAQARALADGASARIRGVALTGADFTDGGGYLDDGTGGIAVLVTGGSFARGDLVEAHGEVDDRFSQRTLRVDVADLAVVGAGVDPTAVPTATGSAGESLEGRLARIHATVQGAPSQLTTGLGFDLDDGSGVLRVIVGSSSGIDVSGWVPGARVETVGVVGQRDSTGAGTVGYRLQPRAPSDVLAVVPPDDPSSPPSGSGSAAPSASPSGSQPPLMTIAEARDAERNQRLRVRGVVTLGTGIVDAGSAVIQDASAGILLRLGDEAGAVQAGQLVEVSGKQSTKSGMLSIQVTAPPSVLGTEAQPTPFRRATGAVGEQDEARLIAVRGAIVAAARRSSSGSVSFEIDDGSGPLRVFAAASLGLEREGLVAGAWVEATGPLGQETSGSQPLRGYRVWLRVPGDLAIVAATTDARATDEGGSATATMSGGGEGPSASIGDLLEGARIEGAVSVSLVAGQWPELGLAAVAWDGTRIAGIVDDAAARAVMPRFLAAHPPPVAVTIAGLDRAGSHAATALPLLRLRDGSQVRPGDGPPAAPASALPHGLGPSWVALVGRLAAADQLERDDAEPVALDAPCPASPLQGVRGLAQIVGIGRGSPARLIAACDGVSRGPRFVTGRVAHTAASPLPAPAPSPQPNSLPLLVAGVTGALGLGVIAAGGIVAWRCRRPPEAEAASSGDVAVPDGPRLSLVPVHRERGSP